MSQAYNPGLLANKSGLEFRSVRAGFVVGKVALGLKFLTVLRVSFDCYSSVAPSHMLYIINRNCNFSN